MFYIGQLLGKVILLAPSLLLLAFAGKRYADVFRLRTLYTHKYTVAAAIPGFKVEAPKFAEEITIAAFKELLSKPSDNVPRQDKEKDSNSGNPFFVRLLEPVVRKVLADERKAPLGG